MSHEGERPTTVTVFWVRSKLEPLRLRVIFFDEGHLDLVAALLFARLADGDVAVETHERTAEAFAVDEHLGFRAVGGDVLDIPDIVFLDKTELFGGDDERLDDDVARAARTQQKTAPRLAVEEVEEFPVADFDNDVVHRTRISPRASARKGRTKQYRLFPKEKQAKTARTPLAEHFGASGFRPARQMCQDAPHPVQNA